MSANAGEDIFNRVVVEGTAANGEKVTVERSASQAAGVVGEPITSPAPDNASFATDTASWTPSSGSAITRDETVFDTYPASGRWDRGGNLSLGDTLTETFTGTFTAGRTYTLALKLRSTNFLGTLIAAAFGRPGVDAATATFTVDTSFFGYQLSWTPTTNTTAVSLTLSATNAGAFFYIDSLALTIAKPTLVDRRGFRRTAILPVKASLTTELAVQIATVWLDAHKTTPFKGTATITGDSAVRHITTGAGVPPEQLLLHTGELLRLSDRIDPDTGGQGRDGRIAEVTYTSATDTATVTLDSSRTSHEALLQRLAVVVGGA